MKFSPRFPDAGKTCWLPTEVPENVDQRIGFLGVTHKEEIIFSKNLTHGTSP